MTKKSAVIFLILVLAIILAGYYYNKYQGAQENLVELELEFTRNSEYQKKYEALLKENPPVIKEIRIEGINGEIIEKDGWIELNGENRIVITTEGKTTQIDIYFTPTGTEAYKLQSLVDTVYPENNKVEYIWHVPEGTMGRFWIIAYNKDVGRKSDSFNVIRLD